MSGGEGGGGDAEAEELRVESPLPCQATDSVGGIASWSLDYYYRHYLKPNREFLSRVEEETGRICEFLKTRCFQDAKVLKVVQGGSLGKGTSMKNGKTDLELFLNIYNLYKDQEKDRNMILKEIARWYNIWKALYSSHTIMKIFFVFNDIKSQGEKLKFIEEIERRNKEWQKQPYLSDADLELLSEVFKSYTAQEEKLKILMHLIEKESKKLYFLNTEQERILDLIKNYTDKKMDRKKIFEETERRVRNRQVKPYSSDVDLVVFLDVFKSYTDQEMHRTMIIEEIERRLSEWHKEPYLSEVDVGLLIDLLKSYRDREKDPRKITRKIEMWLCECKKKLYMSEADLVPLRNLLEKYLKQEMLRKMLNKDIANWRKAGQGERYLSDTDLGFLLKLTKKYTDMEEEPKRMLEEIVRWFSDCKKKMRLELIFEKSKWPNPRVLQFKLRSRQTEDFIDFDILPAYDALGQYDGSMPNPQIYVDLIHTGKSGEFSACFTELQKYFIVGRCDQLKKLICLVKQWYNEVQEKSFPPKYALELLTVYAWEQGSGQTVFNTDEGFRTVLWLIEHYKEIRIYWTKYYDFDNEIIKQYLQEQLCKNRPVILDPADPTANFGEAKGWDRLAEKARYDASRNCCRKQDGSLVEPWNVPLAKEVPWEEEGSSLHSRMKTPRMHLKRQSGNSWMATRFDF